MSRLLLNIGSDRFALDTLGCTPIHPAAAAHVPEILQLLLQPRDDSDVARLSGMFGPHATIKTSKRDREVICRVFIAFSIYPHTLDSVAAALPREIRLELVSHELGEGMLLAACENDPNLISILSELGVDTNNALETWRARQGFEAAEQQQGRSRRPAVRVGRIRQKKVRRQEQAAQVAAQLHSARGGSSVEQLDETASEAG